VQAPHDDNGDGIIDNLTRPGISVTGTWSPRGLIYLNTESFKTEATGRPRTIRAPGRAVSGCESVDNLHYPTDITAADPTSYFYADSSDPFGGTGLRCGTNRPDMVAVVSMTESSI